MPVSENSTASGSSALSRRRNRHLRAVCPVTPAVIGIDQSFTRTGIVVWQDGILWASEIKTSLPDKDDERIAAVAGAVVEALDATRPQAAVIEGYSTGPRSGRKVLTRLGELGGVIKHWLWSYDIPYVDPAPSQVKEFATGFGDASKPTMLRVARRTWPDCPHHDLADAFHMARMGYAHYDEWFT